MSTRQKVVAALAAVFGGIAAVWAKLAGVHICQDEVVAVLAFIPGLTFAESWVRSRVTMWRTRHCRHLPGTSHRNGDRCQPPSKEMT